MSKNSVLGIPGWNSTTTEDVFTTTTEMTTETTTSKDDTYDIVTGYSFVLNLGIPYSNGNTSSLLESINRSIANVTGSYPFNIRDIILEIPPEESRRRFRGLEVQTLLHAYVLSFDVYYSSYEASDNATEILRDFINTTVLSDTQYKASSDFSRSLVDQSEPGILCSTANQALWRKSMYVIANTTFFPLEQELGFELGTLIHDTLRENGFINGTNLEFEVELIQGSYFALCCVNCVSPPNPMIVSISSTGGMMIVVDKTPITETPERSSDTLVIGIVIGGTVCGILLLALCVYGYIVLNPQLKKSEKELKETRNKLKLSSMENVMLAEGWKLQWDEVKLEKKIGEGVAGEVYVGLLHGNMKVAVKTIKDSVQISSAIQDEKEISFMRRCRHPRLVMFLGYGKMPRGDIFLVLELLSHGGMDAQIWRTSLDKESNKLVRDKTAAPSWQNRLQWLHDIAVGMIFLHEKMKCCHRDLKSPNVLLSDEAGRLRAKVSDFGVSKFVPNVKRNIDDDDDDIRSGTSKPRSRRRRHHDTAFSKDGDQDSDEGEENKEEGGYWSSGVGTLEWLAPELIKGLDNYDPVAVRMTEYDSSVDQFSFGCVMYETMELRPPWSHERKYSFSYEIFDAVLGGERPPIMESSPPGYESLMKECWHGDHKKRPLFSKILRRLETIMDSFDDDDDGASDGVEEETKSHDVASAFGVEVEMSSMGKN